MIILSIQSMVVSGRVGNRAAEFILERLGHEPLPVHTLRASNHPGRGAYRGRVTAAREIDDMVRGLARLGELRPIGAVLTGYLAAGTQGPAIVRAVKQVKSANPRALWFLDPVIGDRGRVFVRRGVAKFIRDIATPLADVITPNHFELEYLTGRRVRTLGEARAALTTLRETGERPDRRIAIATGLRLADEAKDTLVTLAAAPDGMWRVATPVIDHPAFGAGDAFAALFLGWYVRTRDIAPALARAAGAIFGVIERSAIAGTPELALVALQDEIVAPTRLFVVDRLD